MKLRDGLSPGVEGSRRRLLYLQPCSSFGGAERQASLNIPRLAKAGFDVLPLVGPSMTIVRWLHDSGVTELLHTNAFPGGGAPLHGWSRAQLPFIYLRSLRLIAEQVEELARSHRIDAILAAMPFSWIAATAVGRRLGIPVIWRAGGTEIRPFEQAILAAWAAFNPPDLMVCCGQAVHDRFAHLVPAPAAVVNNGVDTETFRPGAGDRQRYRPEGAKLVVGFAARLCAQKRPEDFLRMAAEIAPRSFYAACDIIVLPSRSEGCPNVVLESMAMRRALVVSNAAGTREVVAHEREALVFPIGDIAALSDAVRRLIEQPELRRELEARAHQRVETAFSTRTSARELADLLHIVVDRARAPQAEVEVEAAGSLIRYPPVALARPRPWWVPSRFIPSRPVGGGRP